MEESCHYIDHFLKQEEQNEKKKEIEQWYTILCVTSVQLVF